MSSPQPGAVGACRGPHVDVRSDTGGLSQSAAAAVRPVAVHPVAARTDRSFVTCHTGHLPRRSLNQSFKKKSSETFLFQSFFHADGSKTALSTGVLQRAPSRIAVFFCKIFFHPDYTVGLGVSPNHALRLAGCTAGRDFHPALKIPYSVLTFLLYFLALTLSSAICGKELERALKGF